MSQATQRIFAPAKLNLFLHITGKRADGYHTLQSLVVFLDVGDDLELALHDSLHIKIAGPFATGLGSPHDNLVYKAARLLAEYYGVQPHAKITLTKNIPVAAGLGGGSADAAATLKGLVKLWQLPEEPDVLQKIAQQLGTDVHACLYQKPVWVEGIGEKITPQPDMADMHFVLVNPLIQTPTHEVFENFCRSFIAPATISAASNSQLKTLRNDLTDAAIAVTPEIREVLVALSGTECLLHRMSGSGATCFSLYETADAACTASTDLKKAYPQWWVTSACLHS